MQETYDSGTKLVVKFVRKVFPMVDKEFKHWTGVCKKISNEALRKQALASITAKKFHVQGGSIYALYPNVDISKTVKFITAFQTISDYLDNLCDRAGVKDESAFRQLHLSLLDAIDPGREISDYYRYYPYKNDDNYLKSLVEECRLQIRNLPSYNLVLQTMKRYVQLYSDLQTYKHLEDKLREDYLKTWAGYYVKQYPGLLWWEFSAATGSTLGIFMLYAAAYNSSLTEHEVKAIDSAYFPWISCLHILLDYYIDSIEDMQMGDLNFTYFYTNLKQCEERLSWLVERSLDLCSSLQHPDFHATIIKGLLSMYLSDPKALFGLNRLASQNILNKSIPGTTLYYNACRMLRCVGVI